MALRLTVLRYAVLLSHQTNMPKKQDKKPTGKRRVEEVETHGMKFYRIYSGDKFVAMLTEEEYKEQK